jgi:hypothetical protein
VDRIWHKDTERTELTTIRNTANDASFLVD